MTLATALTAAVIPLGVYYPHGLVNSSALPADLELMQAHGFTSLWVKGFGVEETLDISRQAAQHGISVVAAIADLDIGQKPGDSQSWKRRASYYDEWVRKVRNACEFSPPLAAICLGDEPEDSLVADYRRYLETWWTVWPEHPPLTIVTTRWYLPAYYGLGFDVLTNDTYPFFAPGGPGYPDGPYQAWLRTCADNAANGPAYAMGQAFGHRVYTPKTPLRMPTPAEVAWQAYSAIACGCRGQFKFVWSHKPGPEQFVSLAMPEMQAHLAALGVAYRRIAKWASVITSTAYMGYVDLPESSGSVLARFSGPGGNYVLAVAGPEKSITARVKAWLLADVETGRWSFGFGSVSVKLVAGEGRLFRVVV